MSEHNLFLGDVTISRGPHSISPSTFSDVLMKSFMYYFCLAEEGSI